MQSIKHKAGHTVRSATSYYIHVDGVSLPWKLVCDPEKAMVL